MMKFISRLLKQESYESVVWHDSQTWPGVRFAVKRMSLGQRLDLARRVRDLTLKHEFLRAGDGLEGAEGRLADVFASKLYVEWGLAGLEGLRINGRDADTGSLIDDGPVELADEILTAIRSEADLGERERKNS